MEVTLATNYSVNESLYVGAPSPDAYKGLKVNDVDMVRRNFDGYTKEFEYSMEDLVPQDTAGTTETDSKTETGYGSSGYSKINKY
jgi:hypothetical protein